jgi:hypothetical protein
MRIQLNRDLCPVFSLKGVGIFIDGSAYIYTQVDKFGVFWDDDRVIFQQLAEGEVVTDGAIENPAVFPSKICGDVKGLLTEKMARVGRHFSLRD